ncbi:MULTISPECIES: protein rep [Fusobacterium]|nr:protein rep [Fusobacterium hwasookii]
MATKSRKDAYMLNIILEYLKSSFDYEFLFLTLTVPNVAGDELVRELNKQYEAIQRLTKRKEFKAVSKGYVRKTEITYNQERNDFHPHIHMLIAVDIKAPIIKSPTAI